MTSVKQPFRVSAVRASPAKCDHVVKAPLVYFINNVIHLYSYDIPENLLGRLITSQQGQSMGRYRLMNCIAFTLPGWHDRSMVAQENYGRMLGRGAAIMASLEEPGAMPVPEMVHVHSITDPQTRTQIERFCVALRKQMLIESDAKFDLLRQIIHE